MEAHGMKMPYSEFSPQILPHTTWVKTQLFPISPLTLGKLLNLSESQFTHLWNEVTVQPIKFSKAKEALYAILF